MHFADLKPTPPAFFCDAPEAVVWTVKDELRVLAKKTLAVRVEPLVKAKSQEEADGGHGSFSTIYVGYELGQSGGRDEDFFTAQTWVRDPKTHKPLFACRLQMRRYAYCVTDRRVAYAVRGDDGTLTYQSFDHAQAPAEKPTTQVGGARLEFGRFPPGALRLEASAPPVSYTLGMPFGEGDMTLTIQQAGRPSQEERCRLYGAYWIAP